jgi:hypothetical protein
VKLRRLTLVFGLILGLLTFVALAGSAGAAVDPVTIQLKAQNGSGQAGTATLTDMGNNTTKVVVELTNSPAGPQPLHIHDGTCANLTATPKYPLTSLANGKSETTLTNVSLSALLAAPFAINAHKSTTEAAVYVSCGEIVAAAPAATPRTGGGGMASNSSPLAWAAIAALLTITVVGVTFALRRRAA